MIRLASGLVRIPDVAYIAWERLPDRRLPVDPVPGLVPNLVVEVLSQGNTASEMARKRQEYFAAGVQLVWLIAPENHTVDVYTAVDQVTRLDAHQLLDGGAVLPGFTLSLHELFTNFDQMDDGA
jgi:Uma2 family endonuclease